MSIRRMMLFTLGAKIKNLIQAFKERVLATQGEFEAEACLDAQLTDLDNKGLLDSASLIVTPNGYRENLLYSVIPNNTIGDMSLTRATTATRVNADGFIEQVPYNLFQRSEDFENTVLWSRQNILSISTNVANSPIGTLTADKIIPDTTLNQHRIFQQFNFLGQGVLSVYAKADGYNFLSLAISGGVNGQSIYFNLSDGTISGTASGFTPSIENVGNGWYRCSIYNASLGAGVNLSYWIIARESATTANYTGNGTSGILIWGAQLVTGAQPKDYFPTTNRFNIPRIDYSNGSCPSILVEPQRTNLLLQSEDFTNGWSLEGTSITSNTQIAPDNLPSADTLSELGVIDVHRTYRSAVTVTANSLYTSSFFVKKNNIRYVRLVLTQNGSATIWAGAQFDLDTQTFTSQVGSGGGVFTSATITAFANGWFRISVVGSIPSTLMIPMLVLSNGAAMLNTDTRGCPIYLGNISNNLYVWGAQLELGSNITSYIPTTTATVTRNGDVISKTGISSLIGQTQGTLYWEGRLQGQSFSDGVTRVLLSISDGTTNNRIEIYRANNVIQYDNVVGGAIQFSGTVFTITDFTGQPLKLAITYTLNNVKVFINGVLVNTDTTALIPACSQINIGSIRTGSSQWSGLIKGAVLLPLLTNAQAIQLTTL